MCKIFYVVNHYYVRLLILSMSVTGFEKSLYLEGWVVGLDPVFVGFFL